MTLLNDDEQYLDNKLFEECIEAWIHGPVVTRLVHEYEGFGWENIPSEPDRSKFSEDVEDVFNQVLGRL